MDDKNALGRVANRPYPIQQALLVRMPADARQVLNLRMHFNRLPEKLHFLGAA